MQKVYDLTELKTAMIMYKAHKRCLPENLQDILNICFHSTYVTCQSETICKDTKKANCIKNTLCKIVEEATY